MFFVTNRFPKGSIQTRVGRRYEFDLRNNAPSNSMFFCHRAQNGQITEIGGINFLTGLKDSDYRQVLLYIHGFSNLPEQVFKTAIELQRYCDRKDKKEVLVVPVIWPCDSDMGIVQDYWDDQKSADASALSFARVLNRFIDWQQSNLIIPDSDPCLKRINVLAHSMGNRVLRETLSAWERYDLADGVPLLFRNTFLIAADIENESIHRTERAKLICDASRNVIVYFASDDLALRASKGANLKHKIASRRLGHTGPENIEHTPRNVYVVDCDDVNTAYDTPTGHSYFLNGKVKGRAGRVFEHLYGCLKSGRVFPEDELRRSTIIRAS